MEYSLSRNTFSSDDSADSGLIGRLRSFQERLGYSFHDRGLLHTALCHASYSHENGLRTSNERLEFLGDSVLGMIVAHILYETYPEAAEGELSSQRVEFVCRDALVSWAESVGLTEVLLKGKSLKGELPPSIFADAMEAVLGAVYLDGGCDAAFRVVRRYLFSTDRVSSWSARDAKSRLQSFLQAEEQDLPCYEVLNVTGPSHSPLFNVRVRAVGRNWTGRGATRKAAELEAAAFALKDLGEEKEERPAMTDENCPPAEEIGS